MPIQSSRIRRTPGDKRVVGRKRKDRISELPIDVKDRILELLPVQDAARTSILSKKWRYIWAKLPNLNVFCIDKSSHAVSKEIVDIILLNHSGAILKFHLDVSGLSTLLNAQIDRWMSYVMSRNGVRELCLRLSYNSTYALPSYVLNRSTLTHLELFDCNFKSPLSFAGFRNLTNLHLQGIKFVPTTEFCVINCPLLVKLALVDCLDTQYLKIIVSSTLEHLIGHFCPCLNLNLFMNCKGLRKLQLEIARLVLNPIPEHDERSALVNLGSSVAATLEFLQLGLTSLELLSTAVTFPEWAPFVNLQKLSLEIDFGKLRHITCTLLLIYSCPNLSILQILVCGFAYNAEAVLEYLDRPITCLDLQLNKLKYVAIDSYEWSKTELLFVKLLLACAPSLERMCIELEKKIGSSIESDFIKKLLHLPRASPSINRFRILRNTTCTAYVLY